MTVATNTFAFPILSIVVFLPLLAGLLCVFVEDVRQIRMVATGAALADLVLAAFLLARFEMGPHTASAWTFQFADKHDWISSLGISYWIGVDGVSVLLVGLTALMMSIAIIAANFMIADRVKAFMIFMLLLETGILGVFVSLNLFLFYMFWEGMLIPMYFLLGMWGERGRVYATMKFLIYTIFGSFLMLVGIFYLWVQTGTLDMVGPAGLIAHPVSNTAQLWLFLAFGLAFAIKVPLFPFHSWAPAAYTEAPIPVVIALAGILSKAGAFGFIRYCLPLFPSASRELAALVSILAIAGILYAAVLALVQTDMKKIVAYASVSHMNLIVLGIFAMNPTSLDGSVLQMINHSMIIVGLFLAVGYITARTGTRWLPDVGGLGARWPVLMWLFFIFILAGLDLPGLSSFAGEFLILAGVFKYSAWFSGLAALTVIVSAWYMIRFFQRTMNGPVTASPAEVAEAAEDTDRTVYEFPVARPLIRTDLLPREILLFVPLILLVMYLGVQPDPVTSRLNPTSSQVSVIAHRKAPLTAPGGGR